MKQFLDFLPLLLFFAAYYVYGIYPATLAAIIGSALVVSWCWLRYRKLETVPLITLVVISVMGGLTLYLRDPLFIKWKPTLVSWALAVVLLATQYFGSKTALERLLGERLPLPPLVWRRVNFSWAMFFFASGLLNVYVAFFYGADLDEDARTDIWVNFKVFGLTGLSLVFTFVQVLLLTKHIQAAEQKSRAS